MRKRVKGKYNKIEKTIEILLKRVKGRQVYA